jgi:hypothetical protein
MVRITSILLFSALAASSLASQAQDVGQHPAVFAPRQLPAVDPSTFVVGHPASPTWQVARENRDHPAIAVKRDEAIQAIDPNTFLVQPPARVSWIVPGRVSVAAATLEANEVPGS